VNNNASSNTQQGIHLQASSNNNMFTGNSCSNNGNDGIYLFDSSNNTFADNNCSNNGGDGISLQSSCSNSCNNTVTGNMVSNNHHGIYLWDASNNTLANNNASNNNDGILLYASSGNTLANNTVNSNNDYGIELDSSSNNLVYNNHFNNTKNAYDSGNNQWNITKTSGTNIIGGPFLGGNYWSDYAGVDNTGDGLGDTMLSHNSSGHITNGGDYHPLVSAAVIPCDGDICVNTTGWWRDGGTLNASTTPIQAAVDNANAGETICVAAGKYTENVNVNKRLTLRGEGADVVNVTAAGFWRNHVFFVTAGSVNISGFTATGAGHGYAGMHLDNQPSLDSRCAEHCNISGNNCSKNFHGIHLYHSGNNTLLGNTVNSNNAHGIYLFASHNNTLDDNIATSNDDYGIHLWASRNNTLVNNNAISNQQGIFMQDLSNNNTLARNRCSNNVNNGIHLLDSSNNTFADNNVW
jgi:parallel beta-helix repeat protein